MDVPASRQLRVGHIHLHVAEIDPAVRFYRDVLGFGVTMRSENAAFLAAGEYHHHVGVNTWRGVGVPPAPPGVTGLRHWTLIVTAADAEAIRRRAASEARTSGVDPDPLVLRDPSGNAVLVQHAGT
jgi:catechol 2,3-dioxygenase